MLMPSQLQVKNSLFIQDRQQLPANLIAKGFFLTLTFFKILPRLLVIVAAVRSF